MSKQILDDTIISPPGRFEDMLDLSTPQVSRSSISRDEQGQEEARPPLVSAQTFDEEAQFHSTSLGRDLLKLIEETHEERPLTPVMDENVVETSARAQVSRRVRLPISFTVTKPEKYKLDGAVKHQTEDNAEYTRTQRAYVPESKPKKIGFIDKTEGSTESRERDESAARRHYALKC